LSCRGVYACSGIDPALLDVERHDLDPAPRLRIFEAQKSTCVDERSTVEQCAATYAHSNFSDIHFLMFLSDFLMFVALDVPPSTVKETLALGNPK